MKLFTIPLVFFSAAGCAQTGPSMPNPPTFVAEAPLPEGWPQPGPYAIVTEKKYPAYRAAFTEGGGETLSFFRLFEHIKKNGIPMTAPVEMAMEPKGERLQQKSMAFLYRNERVGTPGSAGGRVEVRDVPAFRALTYTWQGSASKENIAKAKAALETELTTSKRSASEFRMLGYNGPDIPSEKQTYELQAVLP